MGFVHRLRQQVLLLQAVCCLGQLSFTSCSVCGHFLGPSGPRKPSPNLLTASLGYMSEKLVSAASSRLAPGSIQGVCYCQRGPLVELGHQKLLLF